MTNDDFLALANHIVPLEVTANTWRSLQQLQFGNTVAHHVTDVGFLWQTVLYISQILDGIHTGNFPKE